MKYKQTYDGVDFSTLLGRVLRTVEVDREDNEIVFHCLDGDSFIMRHNQDCCETVVITEIIGDVIDLLNLPLLIAECVESDSGDAQSETEFGDYDSQTWTFYKLSTHLGSVTIRWHGSSNGYYSESVDFEKCLVRS